MKAVIKKCNQCGKDVEVTHKARLKYEHIFCSKKCEELFKKLKRESDSKYFNKECIVCHKKFHLKKYKETHTNTKCCSKKCSNILRKTVYLGTSNPNRKYTYDENFFEKIDTDSKAWILGWIASDGSISKSNKLDITIDKIDIDVLNTIKNILDTNIPIKMKKNTTLVNLCISSKKIVSDLKKHLNISDGKKAYQLNIININLDLIPHFVRGVFEGDGNISYNNGCPSCSISSKSKIFLEYIGNSLKVPYHIYCVKKAMQYSLVYCGNNCLDFLGKIYPEYYTGPKMQRKYNYYRNIYNWKPCVKGSKNSINVNNGNDNLKFLRTDKSAVLPTKAHESDSGYDLTIIKEVKRLTNNVILYDTGIRAECPTGFYLELVGRSSISKTGYMLANNIGILDSNYKGNIMVALIKIDPTMPDIQLPCKIAQLIIRKVYSFNVEEVTELQDTERNSGGFGSTNK